MWQPKTHRRAQLLSSLCLTTLSNFQERNKYHMSKSCGHGGSVVGFGAFRPEGRRFKSHSSRHVRTWGKNSQLPVALWRVNSNVVVESASEWLMLREAL